MSELEPIERHLRDDETLDPDANLVIRGWPLTIEGLLRNANTTRRRYSFGNEPMAAVSAEVAMAGWNVPSILSGSRLRTRRSYASAPVGAVTEAGFHLLPSFSAPHYSIVLDDYTDEAAERLVAVLGAVQPNPYHVRRES